MILRALIAAAVLVLLALPAQAEPAVFALGGGQFRVDSEPVILDCIGLSDGERCENRKILIDLDVLPGPPTCPPALAYSVLEGKAGRDTAVYLSLINYAPAGVETYPEPYIVVQLGDTHMPRRAQTYVIKVYVCASAS